MKPEESPYRVEAKWLNTTTEPIAFILKQLHLALINIAPEKKKQFVDLVSELNMVILDKDEWQIEAGATFKTILISRGVAELVWISCYSHHLLYVAIA